MKTEFHQMSVGMRRKGHWSSYLVHWFPVVYEIGVVAIDERRRLQSAQVGEISRYTYSYVVEGGVKHVPRRLKTTQKKVFQGKNLLYLNDIEL